MSVQDEGAPPCAPGAGPGQPRMERRFKDFGNPTGRPKGSKNRKTILREIANETHVVRDSGKRRELTTLELVLLRLRNKAIEGKDRRAYKELHRLCQLYQPQRPKGQCGVMVAPAEMSPEEWVARQEELNKTRERPSGYKP